MIEFSPVPKTLEEAIDRIVKGLDEDGRRILSDPDGPSRCHFGLGMTLRNQWGLWGGGKLRDDIRDRFGIGHADDMSSLILDGVHCKLVGKEFDSKWLANKNIQFWKDQNIDPLHPEIDEAIAKNPPKRDWWAWLGIKKP
jgi:hypothetical protein